MTDKFRNLLNDSMEFPTDYSFKFIVKNESSSRQKVEAVLEGCRIVQNSSRNGKYLSYTGTKSVSSSDEILSIYDQAAGIPGLLSL